MGNINSAATSFEKLWSKIQEERISNPQKSLLLVEEMEQMAKKEKNEIYQLCALLSRIEINNIVNDSAYISGIGLLENYYRNEADVAIKAFAAFSLSNLYNRYLNENRMKIKQVTALSGDMGRLPVDEWDLATFEDTIRKLKESTLEKPDILKTCKSENYVPLLNLGKDSRLYRPTLFDFFSYQLVETSTSEEEQNRYLQGIMDFHQADDDLSAYIYAKLEWMKKQPGNELGSENYNRSLEELLQKYITSPASILIRVDWVTSLLDCINKNCKTEDFNPQTPSLVMKICQEGIEAFPNDSRIELLKSLQQKIKEKQLSVEVKKPRVHWGEKIELSLHYANVEEVEITLYRSDEKSVQALFTPYSKLSYKKVNAWKFPLAKSNYYIPLDTILALPAQDYGVYYLDIKPNNQMRDSRIYFVVTNFYEMNTILKENSLRGEFVVLDSKTGSPQESVGLRLFRSRDKSFVSDFSSNKKGEITYDVPKQGSYSLLLSKGDDLYYGDISKYFHSNRETPIQENSQMVSILTDRSIYRLGDKLSFKCYVYQLKEGERKVVPNKSVKLFLYDANYQIIKEMELVTSEYGTAWAHIQLPKDGLPGYYQLTAENGGVSFRVESYKRPTFEVNLSKPQTDYSFGDSIKVEGVAKYLIGVPLNEATIKYKITRNSTRFFPFDFEGTETFVGGGESQMKSDGSFDITFVAEKGKRMNRSIYNYEIEVDITDKGGETRSSQISIPVGDCSMLFMFNTPKRMLFEALNQTKISLLNLDGVGQQREVDFQVMLGEQSVYKGKLQTDKSGQASIDVSTDGWKSGRYQFLFETKDLKNRSVKDSFEVILYRKEDSRPPVYSEIWVHNEMPKEMEWGEKFDLQVGSSLQPAHLLCVIEDEYKIVEKRWYQLSNEIKSIPIGYEKENGRSLKVDLFIVHEGEKYHQTFTIKKEEPSYDLPISIKTFRDRISPNSEEEWELQLPVGNSAEVLVAMYDASLDQLIKHSWSVSTRLPYWINYNNWNVDYFSGSSSFYLNSQFNHQRTQFVGEFDAPGEVLFPRAFSRFLIRGTATLTAARGRKFGAAVARDLNSVVEESAEMEEFAIDGVNSPQMAKSMPVEEGAYRKDFSSTAIFYPNLKPNKDGVVTIKFKAPETLSRWNFKVLAHTKDWRVGQLTKEVVTEKILMIKPNLPRFVREGDEIELTAQVLNLSGEEQKGDVSLIITNPLTSKELIAETLSLNVSSQGTTPVSFRFHLPEQVELLQVQWKVESKEYSDGEQTLLPVLPNRTEVLASLPIVVAGGEKKDVRFDELINSENSKIKHRLYKVELLENPIWSVLQLLSDGGNNVQSRGLNALLYGYSTLKLSKKIFDSHPRISEVIAISEKQNKEQSILTSNLERNEEVKNILLRETPWVTEAKNDQERLKGLARLQDENYVKQAQENYWEKIISLQNEDGGFSWFDGMQSSLYMTSTVVSKLGYLKRLGALEMTGEVKNMLEKALAYIDEKEMDSYERMSAEYKKKYELTLADLHYLYLRSQYPEFTIHPKNNGAYKFYKSHLSDWKEMPLYGRALVAIVSNRENEKKLAQTIVSSLLEYSTVSKEKGIYWQGKAAKGIYSPISFHVAMMEALYETGCTIEQMDGLKTWLLSQKRIQSWDDEISSLEAAYILMLTGSDWVSNNNQVKLTIGGEAWNDINKIGYSSLRYTSSEITPKLGELSIQNDGKTMVWASLYWQYSDRVNEVKQHKTDIQIEKQIMVERITPQGVELEPLKAQKVKVGDRLVSRLVVRTQEDLDYVLLKDQLASCMEVGNQLSGYRFEQGVGYYRSINDASVQYFFEHLPKGTYIFELPFDVSHEGQFSAGIATLQSLYAPDYSANSSGGLIVVEE